MSAAGVDVLTAPEEGGLLFVDVALSAADGFDRVEDAWRSMPPSVLGMCSAIALRSPVVRWAGQLGDLEDESAERILSRPNGDWPLEPDDLVERISKLQRRYGPPRDVFAFELPVNGDPRLSTDAGSEVLAHCRAVELESLLRRNSAIWEPKNYHYSLPSGDHAASFVRLADVFHDRRAASALAAWLRGVVTESTVVVFDSGTITPLIDQLALWVERAAAKLTLPVAGLLGVESLDRYPRSRFQLLRQFKSISDVEVLAILSVSSSGRTYRLLGQSLDETATGKWRAECLVSRDEMDQARALSPVAERGRQNAWLSIGGTSPRREADCPLCRTSEHAHVVRIDPRTFGTMALPAPKHVMPDIVAAARNASLFTAYDRRIGDSVAIQLAPTEASRVRAEPLRRGEQRRRVRFEPLAFLLKEDVADLVAARVTELEHLPVVDSARKQIGGALSRLRAGKATVVVCDGEEITTLARALRLEAGEHLDEAEARQIAEERFLAAAKVVCPTVKRVVSAARGEHLGKALGRARSFLLFVAGLQTGVTLQHLVVQVQDAVKVDPAIHGLVLHAHPHDSGAWGSVRNTFGGQSRPALLALWLTYLPPESPFVEEFDLLQGAQNRWFDDARFGARERLQERLAWVRSGTPAMQPAPPVASPLWSPVPMRLRRTSRYGGLDDRQVVAAIGAAVSESLDRHDSDSAPEWVQIDLPNAFRSYFDGLLHAALLRWTMPARAWWGPKNVCQAVIEELYGRFHATPDWRLLLAELLLAAAEGKLPEEGTATVLTYANAELSAGTTAAPGEPHELGFVELGYILASKLLETRADPDRRETDSGSAVAAR